MTPLPPDRSFNWRCAFGLHPWGKWSEVGENRITTYAQIDRMSGAVTRFDPPILRSVPMQMRSCSRCNLTQHRAVLSSA
jgi:hypothetical protein